jgi:hypothetical protein
MKFLENARFDWMDLLNFHERPFRAKLIPAKVWKDLDNYRNDSVGLSNYFKKWRTKLNWKPAPTKAKMYETYLAVGGEYSPDDRQIEIHIYTLNFDKFPFTDKTWDKFKYKLLQVEMHELIHFMQYDRRGNEWSNYIVPYKKLGTAKVDRERKYLSEFDEIQAYAHCVFLDFKTKRPHKDIDTLLSRAKTHRDSPTLNYFLKTFNYDYRNNAAIPKIMQQIGKWERKYKRLS